MSELNYPNINVEQATAILHINKPLLYRLCKSKKIKHLRLGHKLFFFEQDLIDFIASVRVDTATTC